MRNLHKSLEKIVRKAAVKIVRDEAGSVNVRFSEPNARACTAQSRANKHEAAVRMHTDAR